MEKGILITIVSMIFCLTFLLGGSALAGHGSSDSDRTIDPIVSTEWLAANWRFTKSGGHRRAKRQGL